LADANAAAVHPSGDWPARLAALVGGVLVALSLPPWGLWWLAPVGYGLFAGALRRASGWRGRTLDGAAFGVGCFVVGLYWLGEFTIPGAVIAVALSALMYAVGAALVPRGPTVTTLGFAAMITLTELVRYRVPFGGLPLAGAALGQVDGPAATVGRLSGDLGLVFVVALVGSSLAAAVVATSGRSARAALEAVIAFAVAATAVLASAAIPAGVPLGQIAVAYVQGGGARGLRASDNDAAAVYGRHLAASAALRPGLDLVVWPEDVIDIGSPITEDPTRDDIAALAQRLGATVVVGVVEESAERFKNAAVAFDLSGNIADRYDKVHRVPFGEYVPFRSVIARLADLSDVPRDAIAGKGPGVLLTRAGSLGVLISYEVFFADRARAAVRAGGEVILVPTNAASFRGKQVPAQEVAAARLRAMETGRAVIQAAPTGYSVFVDADGDVHQQSRLGRRQVETATVTKRTGFTPYVRYGDAPVILTSAALSLAAWQVRRRRRDRSEELS